ncbi:hypothetical protein DRQ53_12475, partial [bacterium]
MNTENHDATPYADDRADTHSLSPATSHGVKMGPYLLRERIGVGGMGEVWLAQQTAPIQRTVAVKLIKAGMDTADVLARFEAERQALALMDHTSIARVYDAGTTPEGRPFFAMEYVRGVPIGEYCDQRRLTTRERLELFQKVCLGVQHAHQKSVLHRDLKPSNVLVADIDGVPSPKIIDFGVAKATSHKLTDKTMYTSIGQMIGTPEYMSPEQAEPTREDVDTRTDVYSLGVILYELLAGALPFDASELREAGLEGILKVLREQDPPKPSTRLTGLPDTIARSRRTETRRLSSDLRGDLDWIVMRALEKDRNRRYGSPAEFAQDIQRHLDHEAVLAGPPTARYRTSKFVRRHRTGVTIAVASALALAAFAVTSTLQAQTIARERDRASVQAATASAMNDFLSETLASADPWSGGIQDATVVAALDAAALKVDTAFEGRPEVEASIRAMLGETYLGLGKLEPGGDQIERAVQLRVQHGGPDQQELGSLRLVEAWLRELTTEHETAVTSAADGARIFRMKPDAEIDDLLAAYQIESRNLLYMQRYAEADSVLALAEEITTSAAGAQLIRSAEIFSLRGDLYYYRDNNSAAADSLSQLAYERAISIDPVSPEAPIYLNNAAQYRSNNGDYESALAAFDVALALHEERFGTDHPDYATCLENRGSVLFRLKRPNETLAALEQVLDIRTRHLGASHVNVVRTGLNVGTVAWIAGDLEKALAIFQELKPVLIEARGTDHPDVLVVTRNEGSVLRDLGRHAEAETAFAQALEISRRMHGDNHTKTARARADYGSLLTTMKRYTEAEDQLTQAYEVNRAEL